MSIYNGKKQHTKRSSYWATMFRFADLLRHRTEQQPQSSIPLRPMHRARFFPPAFLQGFQSYLEQSLQQIQDSMNCRLQWVSRYRAGDDRDRDRRLFCAILVDNRACQSRSEEDDLFQSFEQVVEDKDGSVYACSAVYFDNEEDNDNESVSVMQMWCKPELAGHRLSCQLLCLCLLRMIATIDSSSVDWTRVQVKLDDCTEVLPPRNLYYRLGFRVWNPAMEQFVRWDEWQEQCFDPVHRPYPDEQRQTMLQDLLWNLTCFLGFKA